MFVFCFGKFSENGFIYVPPSNREESTEVKNEGILDLFELEERERGFKVGCLTNEENLRSFGIAVFVCWRLCLLS